jgi:hypothetical protein
VSVSPNPVTLTIAQTATLTATVNATNCSPAPSVSWSSGSAAVGLLASGTTAQITGVSITGPVAVTASAGGQFGSSQVTVTPAPGISLSVATLTFSAVQGSANPASQFITITNGGGGTLSGLSAGTITYGAGATGWLQAPTLSTTTAPATLTVQPVTGALTAGTYTATIPVQSGVASNSPQTLTVTFTVAPPPAIALSSASVTFTATEGGANPATQFITITNSGGGTLSGLTNGTITYGAGATGWLQAPIFSATTAPATLAVLPVTGALTPGTYTATIPVQSGVASNSPQDLTVSFTVAPSPVIGLSSATLTFSAIQGGADPASQFITITNSGSGTLTGLGTGTITYGAGATGWLQAPILSATTAPATLTVQPVTGALTPGTYTATIPVQSGVASNSPQNLTVTFTVASPPAIALSSASLTFTAAEGGANPASQFITITNSGGGTLSGLSTGTIIYGAGASGWLQAPVLSATTAPATLTLQPVTGALTPGTYTATIPVQSGVASNSPQTLTVTFTVASQQTVVAFVGNNQTGLVGFALNIRPGVRLTGPGNTPVPNVSVTFIVASGGGSVTGATVNTNASGVAQVGSWILGGSAGPNTLTATVAGAGIAGNPVTFTATGQTSAFNIDVQNVGAAFTPAVQAAYNAAISKWQSIIFQDLPLASHSSTAGDCLQPWLPAIGPVNVDDVLIVTKMDSTLDGPGGLLGRASPCYVRGGSLLPIMGFMIFDAADVASLAASGQLNSVILHEMGHVLGFGSLWTQAQFDCLQNASTPPGTILDTYFSCPKALAMFDSIGGTSYTGGNKVPVENCGPASPVPCGAGNVNGHWREPTFDEELMTGYLQVGVSNPLSRLSAAAMEDLGYGVNYAGSDNYVQIFTLRAGAPRERLLNLGDDIYRGPIYVVDRSGRVVGVIQPR